MGTREGRPGAAQDTGVGSSHPSLLGSLVGDTVAVALARGGWDEWASIGRVVVVTTARWRADTSAATSCSSRSAVFAAAAAASAFAFVSAAAWCRNNAASASASASAAAASDRSLRISRRRAATSTAPDRAGAGAGSMRVEATTS